jgi:peptidoglycan/xylan/chitin deacetylase (PgdA/CDA1 family)
MSRKIACITLDIEPDFCKDSQQIRLFEDPQLMDRYVSIIRNHNVKVTGFVVTALLKKYGDALHQFRDAIPLEFGVHSHDHDITRPCTPEQIKKSYHSHKDFWGEPPQGYRAPVGLIDKEGVQELMAHDFQYDASIFPSLRMDRHGFSNLNLPVEPFYFVSDTGAQLLELPFACLKRLRIVFSLSYVKLLGYRFYRALMSVFPLPDIVVLDSHPYDFYVPQIAHYLKGWKKTAHMRNGKQAFALFEEMIKGLKKAGYEFMFMSELAAYLASGTGKDLPQVSLAALNR